MTYSNTTPNRRLADNLDRILLIGCAVIWVLALGAAVAAIVALVDLGRGPQTADGGSGTPWLLYTVIVVSALVIIAAVPLLLRARRAGDGDSAAQVRPRRVEEDPNLPAGAARGIETPTGKLRMFGPPPEPVSRRPGPVSAAAPHRRDPGFPAAAVDQIYLRFGLSTACALGAATAAIGTATYLMANDSDTLAWVAYGVAAVITVASAALPWYHLKELNAVLARR